MAKNWLLFDSDCDGEYYRGAFGSEKDAKAKAVELWDRNSSFVIRNTEDDGVSVYGGTSYKKDSVYLDWSDEKPTDISGQKEKIAQFQKEDKESAERRAALLKKRDSGAKLSLGERMSLSMYDQQDAMLANLLSNSFGGKIWPDGQPLISTSHPMGAATERGR